MNNYLMVYTLIHKFMPIPKHIEPTTSIYLTTFRSINNNSLLFQGNKSEPMSKFLEVKNINGNSGKNSGIFEYHKNWLYSIMVT